MSEAFLCDGERTEAARSANVEAAELAALALRALVERLRTVAWPEVDDVVVGLPEVPEGRDPAAALRAVLPAGSAAVSVRRGTGSGLDVVAVAARAIKAGEADLVLAAIVPPGQPGVACALVLASERGALRHGLRPLARIVGTAVAPAGAARPGHTSGAVERLLARVGIWPQDVAVYQVDDGVGAADAGGAHLVLGAARELVRRGGRYAVSATVLGEGQGIATLLERA